MADLTATDLGPAHRYGHRLFEISEAGAVVAKIAAEPKFVEQVLGAQLGKQTSLTKQPAGETREPFEANAGCLGSDRPHSPDGAAVAVSHPPRDSGKKGAQ
jgi:hypothetical protein